MGWTSGICKRPSPTDLLAGVCTHAESFVEDSGDSRGKHRIPGPTGASGFCTGFQRLTGGLLGEVRGHAFQGQKALLQRLRDRPKHSMARNEQSALWGPCREMRQSMQSTEGVRLTSARIQSGGDTNGVERTEAQGSLWLLPLMLVSCCHFRVSLPFKPLQTDSTASQPRPGRPPSRAWRAGRT